MSDNRNDPTIGRDERDRQAEFGNAEDSERKDTQNTREDSDFDSEFGDTTGGQAEEERGVTGLKDKSEGALGTDDEKDDDAFVPDAQSESDSSFGRNGD